jgi:hypothetical protein
MLDFSRGLPTIGFSQSSRSCRFFGGSTVGEGTWEFVAAEYRQTFTSPLVNSSALSRVLV